MSGFELFFSFYGLLLGLSAASVATGLARLIRNRSSIKVGILTPLLALFVLFDIASFWITAWVMRNDFKVSWGSIYFALGVSVIYYLSASLVFPEQFKRGLDLDQYYWRQRRFVLCGIGIANLTSLIAIIHFHPPELTDILVYVWEAVYYVPLAGLLMTRSRKLSAILLAILIIQYALSPFLPGSDWGQSIGF